MRHLVIPIHHVIGALCGITFSALAAPLWLAIVGGFLLWATVVVALAAWGAR